MIPSRRSLHGTSRSDHFVVGVDIGGTNTAVGVVDESGTLLRESRFSTNPSEGAVAFVKRLAHAMEDLLQSTGSVRAIGIACPAVNMRKGVVENPANLGWGTVDLAGMLQEYFGVPITLLNDGDAAAIGEIRFGVARGLSHVVMLTLGTGLGAGIMVDGELVRGTNGTGGELGHIIVVPGGRMCACGRRGCAETYVSATGVCRTVVALQADHTVASPLRDIPFANLTALRVFEFARDGDTMARLAFEETGHHLGSLLANMAAIFDPEAFVLYGGLVHAGELLLEPAVRSFQENVLERYKKSVKILVSHLNDGQASILGAGAYALQTLTNQKAGKVKAMNPT